MFHRLKLRLRALFRRDEIDGELETHLGLATGELISQGMSPREARLTAERQFGSAMRIAEKSRDVFRLPLLEDLWRDLGYTVRVVRRTPLFFAGIVVVLALGIGANCAIFNLVYAVLLRPMPYADPDRVLMLTHEIRLPDGRPQYTVTANRVVRIWRERAAGLFSDLAVLEMWDANKEPRYDLVLPDRAERLKGGLVTSNFFTVLGAEMELGRPFTPRDESAGRDDLAVLSYATWQRLFGGDRSLPGRSITLIGGEYPRKPRSFTVVGVLRPDFRFTYPVETEIWTMKSWRAVNASHPAVIQFNGAVGRLAPGVSLAAAKARMAGSLQDPNRPGTPPQFTRVETIRDWVVGETRPSILLVAGVALLLFLTACVTVANAFLVRLAERTRELAVRASLGAGRTRISRQLLTEVMAVSVAGTVAGVALAALLVPLFRSLVPLSLPRGDELRVEPGFLLTAGAVAALVTTLVLMIPALQRSGDDAGRTLKHAAGGVTGRRWRFTFVSIQTTLATALLVGTVLLLVSFWRLNRVELGFEANHVVTAEMRLLDKRYFAADVSARFQQAVLEQVRSLPGVLEASLTSAVPFRGVDWTRVVRRVGESKSNWGNCRDVDSAYFSIMRMRLLRGRLLDERDTKTSEPVIVVSESFARKAFPGEDPIGQQLDFEQDGYKTIVGVVNDVRYRSLDIEPYPAMYVPKAQVPSELICLMIRTTLEQRVVEKMLRDVVHRIDPAVPVMDVTTIDRIISESVAGRRFYTTVTAAFALLALALTATGLAVVIARSVAERRREMAIRSALGARSPALIRMVVGQGLTPVAAGVGAGLFLAWFGARILTQFLFQVRVHEPGLFVVAGAFTLVVGCLACLAPARKIGRLAPAAALHEE